jgi:hypothetical protein
MKWPAGFPAMTATKLTPEGVPAALLAELSEPVRIQTLAYLRASKLPLALPEGPPFSVLSGGSPTQPAEAFLDRPGVRLGGCPPMSRPMRETI